MEGGERARTAVQGAELSAVGPGLPAAVLAGDNVAIQRRRRRHEGLEPS